MNNEARGNQRQAPENPRQHWQLIAALHAVSRGELEQAAALDGTVNPAVARGNVVASRCK
jgi:hypothetical protein